MKIPIQTEELETFARHAAVSQYILARVIVDPECLQAAQPFRVKIMPILGTYIHIKFFSFSSANLFAFSFAFDRSFVSTTRFVMAELNSLKL